MRCRSLLLALTLLVPAACGTEAPEAVSGAGRERPRVLTTFYPTTYLAERIGGDRVDVACPLPEGADPIFWMPDADTIGAYQEADLILVNGAGFEKWVDKASLPLARVVDTAAPFRGELLTYADAVVHSHGTGGEHAHEGIDGHVWLDPRYAILQAREIEKALARLLPDQAAAFASRARELESDLEALDAALRALGPLPQGLALYASHPAYNYPARRYGWRVVNLDLDPAEMPGDEAIAAIRARLAAQPGRVLLWESQPLPEIAARLESELGLASVLFSPCEAAPAEGDYLSVMRANIDRLRLALERGD